MQKEDIQFPDVNYGANNKERYTELTEKEWSPFYGFHFWEVFIFCMSYAYAQKLQPTDPKGQGTMNAKSFLMPTRWLMQALAIEVKKDISVIKDSNTVVRICERYANAGIKDVYIQFKNRASEKSPESMFLDMMNQINKYRD